jgi:TPR repeat protein
MSKLQYIVWLVCLALLSTSVQAQLSFELPLGQPDSRTLKVQRKVDELFERGEYDRAYFIYRNELVPVGDKYAQYMIGFMHLTGRGVDEDPVIASAWYRLAAERGTPQFVAIRDMLMSDITEDERRNSDQLFLEIRRKYSDLAILLSLVKRSARSVDSRTGSRLETTSSRMNAIDARSLNPSQSGAAYYGHIESELQGYLMMLSEIGDFPELETDPARLDLDEIERLVNERLETIQN